MELIGQASGTTLYGDRSAELVAAGGPKLFRAPFRGFIKAVSSDDEAVDNLVVTINNRVVHDIPSIRPSDNNSFELGDTIAVVGTPLYSVTGDRIGVEVGTIT